MICQILAAKDWKEWSEDKTKPGKRLGTVYTVVKTKMKGPVLIDVKVPAPEVITADELKARTRAHTAVWGDFQDLDDDQYIDKTGALRRTGSAESVTLVDDGAIDL